MSREKRTSPPQNVDYLDDGINETAGRMFKIENFDTDIPDNPNGVYIEGPATINNKPYFVRLKFKPEEPMFIWWQPNPKQEGRGLWLANNRNVFLEDRLQKNSNPNAKAASQDNADHPKDISKGWLAFNSEGNFQRSNMMFSPLTEEEETRSKVMKMKISGRKGYNRAMNGTYLRGKKIHAGRSYWRHTDNDFTIRWFKTKWVIDWRGLHNDNIGAAVCKEDCPEPWMCNIPFRVYDGKAKDKKWKYEPGLKFEPLIKK